MPAPHACRAAKPDLDMIKNAYDELSGKDDGRKRASAVLDAPPHVDARKLRYMSTMQLDSPG